MRNEAYNVDCMEYMKNIPDKYFDLAVCDPPYGIGEGGQKSMQRGKYVNFSGAKRGGKQIAYSRSYITYDDIAPDRTVFDEIIRCSKNQIFWGANHLISRFPFDSHCWLVWDKQNGESDFADCELAWTSFDSAVRIFRYRWNGMLQGKNNVKTKQYRIHPNEKPYQLYEWIYRNYVDKGEAIFDPFLGSGSSRIAAYDCGCDFVGYEKSFEYFKAQEERFQNHIMQQNLFLTGGNQNTDSLQVSMFAN